MASNIAISSPFLKSFVHADVTVGTAKQALLAPITDSYMKRIVVIVQNTSDTANVQVWGDSLGASSTNGIVVFPKSSLVLDNYNGGLWSKSSIAGTSVHVAYSAV
ncbi:hypothetical protein CCP3SC1AL1_400008 [Gammaproteobacteria bacterium]